jgi:hypothetical protein
VLDVCQIQKTHIKVAAEAAGVTTKFGWKTFRLDETNAPVGVQRELMRHASLQTP